MSSSTTAAAAATSKAKAPAEGEELSGKCSYPNCQHDDEETTAQVYTLKNTDYKFHYDCYSMWAVESRNNGKFSVEDRVKVLDEQKKNKSGTAGTTAKETKK